MNRKAIIAAVVVAVVLIAGYGLTVGTYNRLVGLDETTKASWAQVENQLRRRLDLIPNLVETVKGYAAHEREVLTEVTRLRARAGQAQTVPESIAANEQLGAALARLLVIVESYPQLRANENFIRLQDELAGTENRISVERRRYNEAVREYDVAIRTFPASVIAGLFGFERAPFFEAPKTAEEPPAVKF